MPAEEVYQLALTGNFLIVKMESQEETPAVSYKFRKDKRWKSRKRVKIWFKPKRPKRR